MGSYMGDISNLGSIGSGNQLPADLKVKSKSDSMGLDMTSFLKLMVAELTNRSIDQTADTSDMLNQMVQMQMVQALVKMAGAYGTDSLPTLDFTVSIDHRYPIADDEDAERTLDLQEVSQQARSRKCYMRKWHPNEDSDSELLDDGFEDGIREEIVESKLE